MRVLAAISLFVLALATCAMAQEQSVDGTICRVEVQPNTPAFRALAAAHGLDALVGRELDPDDVHRVISGLQRTSQFTIIEYVVEYLECGLLVRVVLTTAPKVAAISVSGNDAVETEDLLALGQQLVGQHVSDFLLDKWRREVIQSYHRRGYYRVDVTIDRPLLESSRIAHLRVSEGERFVVQSIVLPKLDPAVASLVKRALCVHDIQVGVPAVEETVSRAVVDAVNVLRDAGYLDAIVDHKLMLSDGAATLRLGALTGNEYTLRSIVVDSEALIKPDIAALRRRSEGETLDKATLQDITTTIQRALWTQGYPDARVESRQRRSEDLSHVDLEVFTQVGERAVVGTIVTDGNRLTSLSTILAHNQVLVPGEVLDRNLVHELERALVRTPWCAKVRVEPQLPDPRRVSSDHGVVRDIVIIIDEREYIIDRFRTSHGTTGSPTPRLDWPSLTLSPVNPTAQIAGEQVESFNALASARNLVGFQSLLAEVLSSMPESIPEALLLKGDAALLDADWFSAVEFYETLIHQGPGAAWYTLAVERELAIADAVRFDSDTPAQLAPNPQRLQFDHVEELLIRVQERMPGSEIAERASRLLIDMYKHLGNVDMAIVAAEIYLMNHPGSPHRREVTEHLVNDYVNESYKGYGFEQAPLHKAVAHAQSLLDWYPPSEVDLDAIETKRTLAMAQDAWTVMRSLDFIDEPQRLVASRSHVLEILVVREPRLRQSAIISELRDNPDQLLQLPDCPLEEIAETISKDETPE